MISNLYIIPTYSCNLNCQHCEIHKNHIDIDQHKFLNTFAELEYEYGILFGGEPLLSKYLPEILATNHIESISTNLLLLTEQHIQLIKQYRLDVSTSWNPTRFKSDEFELWLKNIQILLQHDIHITVLITLTSDLFKSNIKYVLDRLECLGYIDIKFETYVPANDQLISQADDWLVEITKNWKWQKLKNILAIDYRLGNIHLCRNIWTLEPNGNLKNSCPTTSTNRNLDICCRCKYVQVCKPCQKQSVCTFYQKFYEFVMESK